VIHSIEYVLSDEPFVIRRAVRWSDCDPAGVVYTGKFPEYVLSAVGLFTDHMAGRTGKSLGEAHGVGTPCRGMSLDFLKTLWPGDVIEIECAVGAVRTRSFDIHCRARTPKGEPVFDARFSPICVRLDARIATNIPASLRAVLERHVTASPTLKDALR
jgi:4-hydroxybenzoyl-CoA thioesterase